LTENSIIINDDNDDDSTDQSNHISHQMTMNTLRVGGENINRDTNIITHTGEGVANSDPDDAAIPQGDDRSAIAISTSFFFAIPESDSGATLEEERQLHPSI
jgi:hypothetical protein